jgi:hypothetical protein
LINGSKFGRIIDDFIRFFVVKYPYKRTPKNYDGTAVTTHNVTDILPSVLSKISEICKDRPDLILEAWPEIIGPKLAGMTQAVSLRDGELTVKVKNSTLHSLLSRHDKFRMRDQFNLKVSHGKRKAKF